MPSLVPRTYVTFFLPLALAGCVKVDPGLKLEPFADNDLDACLAIMVDTSGSFQSNWEDRAYPVFLQLMDEFFAGAQGSKARIVIGQMSGNQEAMLFEGPPADLRKRFQSAEELNAFLQEHSDPSWSPVYAATERAIDYVTAIDGLTDKTRLLTVFMSDLADSEQKGWQESHKQMLATLKRYEQMGGGLAFYFVDAGKTGEWKTLLDQAGFKPQRYIIESTLVDHPRLPRFQWLDISVPPRRDKRKEKGTCRRGLNNLTKRLTNY